MCAALSDSFVRLPYTESFCNPYFSISQYPDRSITIISCNNFIPYTMYNRIASVSPSIVNYCYLHSRFKVLKCPQHSYSDEGHPVRCCKRLQQRAAGRCKAAEQQRPNYRPEPRSVLGTTCETKYSLQGTTQGRYLTGGVPPVRFSM